MVKDLYDWMIQWASTPYASYALFFIAFAESSFFPLPPDLLLIPMCVAQPHMSFVYALICTVGSTLGGGFGYGLGRFGGRPLLRKLFSIEKLDWVEKVYKKYDAWAIGIAGFSPIPYKVFSVSAGVFHIKFMTLMLVSFVARGGRFFLIGGLIYFFGKEIQNFIDRYFNILTIVFTVCLIGGFVAIQWVSKSKMKQKV